MVTSLTDVASSAALLGRLVMPDDRALAVSSSLFHARTTAVDSAAAAGAKKHTADVKRAYNTSVSETSRISVLSFPSSIDPSDAA